MTRIDPRIDTPATASDAPLAPVDAAASAVEGAVPSGVRKGPAKKSDYPGLSEGKLSDIPGDFNPTKHTALKESDFNAENVDRFYAFKAAECRRVASLWEGKADRSKALGGVKDKKTAMKLQTHLEGLKAMILKLAAQGDVSGLDANMLEMVGLDASLLSPPTA